MADIATLGIEVDSRKVRTAGTDLGRLENQAARTERATDKMSKQFNVAGNAMGALSRIASTLIVSLGIRDLVKYADTWKLVDGRLNLVTDSVDSLASAERDLFNIAQKTRQGYEQTADLYARIARSTKSLNIEQSKLLSITETINKALIISGGSASSNEAALIQLGQGFAAGALRGEELNSVLEQTPRLAQAIADGMGTTIGKLRALAAEGMLTSDAIVAALTGQANAIDTEFNQMGKTVGQSFVQLNNSILKYIGEADTANGLSGTLADGISYVSDNVELLAKSFGVLLGMGIAAQLATITLGFEGATAAAALFNAVMAINPFVAAAMAIGGAVSALYLFRDSTIEIGNTTATIGDFIGAVWDTVSTDFVDFFDNAYNWFTERSYSVFNSVGNWSNTSFKNISSQAKHYLNILIGTFISSGEIIGKIAAAISLAFEGIPTTFDDIMDSILESMKKPFTTDYIGDFEDAATQALQNIGDAIVRNTKLRSAMPTLNIEDKKQEIFTTDDVQNITDANAGLNDTVDALTAISDAINSVTSSGAGYGMASIFDGLAKGLDVFADYKAEIIDGNKEIFDLSEQIADKELKLAKAKSKGLLDVAEDLQKQIGQLSSERADLELDVEKKKNQQLISMSTAALDGIAAVLQGFAAQQDQSNKDGFESAKKLNMGVAVVSTAAAIMRAFSDLGWPAGIPAAAAAAAMGAAQISNINSTSFGGGGSVASIGAISLGSNSGYAPTTGTVLGDMGAMSQSTSNVEDLLESIHAKEYRELRSIAYSMQDLNANITGLVSSIVRSIAGGDGTSLKSNLDPTGFGDFTAEYMEVLDDIRTGSFITDQLGSIGEFMEQTVDFATSLARFTGTFGLDTWIGDNISSIIGGGTETKLKGTGYDIASITAGEILAGVDAYVQEYAYIKEHTKGGLFSSGSSKYYYMYEDANADITNLFTTILGNLASSVSSLALGLGGVAAQTEAMAYTFDIGKIELKDLDSDEINEVLSAMISTQADLFVEAIIGPLVKSYQKVDEGLLETATRLLVSKVLVVDSFNKIGKAYNEAEKALMDSAAGSIAVSNAIVEAAGGIEEYQKTIESFFDQFFTDFEKQAFRAENLTGIVDDMGMSLPDTRQGYRDLVAAIDISTASGQAAYVQLLELTDLAGEYYDYLEKVESNRFDLTIQLLNLQEKSIEAVNMQRAKELEELDPSNRALQEHIWALQDEATAADAATKALDDAKKAAESRMQTIESDLRDAFNAQAESMQEAYQKVIDSLNDQISSVSDNINGLSSALSSIVNARQSMESITRSSILSSTLAINAMTAQVKSGNYTELDDLDYHLGILTADNTDQYAQFEDYQRDFLKSKVAIDRLGDATSDQLTVEEQTLESLNNQLAAEETYYNAQIASNEAQLNALLGINNSVLSVVDAIAALELQQQHIEELDKTTPQIFAGTSEIDQIYAGLLGRAADDEGKAYWEASGFTGDTLVTAITNAAVENGEAFISDTFTAPVASAPTALSTAINPSSGLSDAQVVSGWADFLASQNTPAFATGGTHLGGLRMVGENGPELEYTGPSAITSNAQTRQLLSNDDVVAAIDRLSEQQRAANYAIAKNTLDTKKILDRWDGDGQPEVRDVA